MIIGLCGRVGAGKETLTSFLREKGFVYYETSKLINEELVKLGIEVTRTHQQDWADKQREKFGVGALMRLMLEKANQDKTKNYIFDSLRNAGEAEFLKKECEDFILIGVDAPQKLRFERIISRNKLSDPKTWEEFLIVDERDNFDLSNPMGQQTGKLLEIADFVIVNDASLEKSMNEIKEVWERIEAKNNMKKERVSIFIDGSNLYHSLKKLGDFKMDFEKLLKELSKHRILVTAFYYIAPLDITLNEEKYWDHQKFLTELEKISNFKVVLCTLRKYKKEDGTFSYEVKGDDVHLANDVLVGAYENLYDVMVLVSGDEDFIPIINTLKRLNKKTENAFFKDTSSRKLRQLCDKAINLNNILDRINYKNE